MTTAMLTAVVLTTTIPLALPFGGTVRPLRRTWVLRCRSCKAYRRLDEGTLAPVTTAGGVTSPAIMCCGYEMTAKPLKGRVTEHVCNAKCRASTGHVCECSCGGKNHGRDA